MSGHGEVLGLALAFSLWEAREVLGLVGKQVSELPQGWNIVNKNVFLPILIVESYTKVPNEWAPVDSVYKVIQTFEEFHSCLLEFN